MSNLQRKTEIQNEIAHKLHTPLIQLEDDIMLSLLKGMLVNGSIKMYNIVVAGDDETKRKVSLVDEETGEIEDYFDDELEGSGAYEITTSDRIHAFKAIQTTAKYLEEMAMRKLEADAKKSQSGYDLGELSIE